MSDRNLPAPSEPLASLPALSHGPLAQARIEPQDGEDGIPWGRYFAAVLRNKWFVVATVILGTAAGVFASRQIDPVYEAHATIWVSTSGEGRQQSGPIRAAELLQSSSWVELLRSFAIADSVVEKLHLYVTPKVRADAAVFAHFDRAEQIRPGHYTLTIGPRAQRYRLADPEGAVIDSGLVGDSIGRKLGFLWRPDRALLTANRKIEFSVTTPRAASMALLRNLTSILPEDGQFLRLIMRGRDPQLTAATLNVWAAQFVASATELKKHNLTEFRKILESQLDVAERELHAAEMDLERFRIQTITLPSENAPVAGGVELTRAPVLQNYFEQKTDLENVRHDREALEAILRQADSGPLPPDALFTVPGVVASTPPLRAALDELTVRRAELRVAQRSYTDAHPRVLQLAQAIATLERETIPQLAQGVLRSLREREAGLQSRIAGASRELRAIPSRTIEEMRLRRQVSVTENLYNTLKARYEEAKLAEAGTTPDVSVLDVAVPPQLPQSNQAPRLIFLAFVASIGLAVGVILVLDRMDRRFRYPEQATKDLGLSIVGSVPRLAMRRKGAFDVESMARLVEAFRAMRLSVRHSWAPGRPIALTISSPGPGEGKSLVAANLAVSFAASGHRVVLVDGDVRRGALHRTFQLDRGPGLIDYLTGTHEFEDIVQTTGTENLTFIGSGSRPVRAPELLASDRLLSLVSRLRNSFDVMIADAPPLYAGSDPFALGVATGSMMLVLRTGVSDRRLAEAKLRLLDRLPVNVIGAVLNGIEERGMYRYYGYSYAGADPSPVEELAALAAPVGAPRN